MIVADAIVVRYGPLRALDGFSLAASAGEVIGLVGPNGAGKTTLMKALATLIRPDEGRAEIAGHDVTRAPRLVRRHLGYLPDTPGVYQDMRIAEFLEFFADAFELRGARRRAAVERALARAELTERRHDFVEHLSLGLKQRLVLAKTLLHDPQVLLLDEPATGLDPLARLELRHLLKALGSEGLTVLISSHILTDLEEICSRVVFIASGRNTGADIPASDHVGSDEMTCLLEVTEGVERAVEELARQPGVRLIRRDGARLTVGVGGGPAGAATLLRQLVERGIGVWRFDAREAPLEERYRQTFGGQRT